MSIQPLSASSPPTREVDPRNPISLLQQLGLAALILVGSLATFAPVYWLIGEEPAGTVPAITIGALFAHLVLGPVVGSLVPLWTIESMRRLGVASRGWILAGVAAVGSTFALVQPRLIFMAAWEFAAIGAVILWCLHHGAKERTAWRTAWGVALADNAYRLALVGVYLAVQPTG